MSEQLQIFEQTKPNVNTAHADLSGVMPLCPRCGQKVMIEEDVFRGNTIYTIIHPKPRMCGLHLYGQDKAGLIEWYKSMEWHEA